MGARIYQLRTGNTNNSVNGNKYSEEIHLNHIILDLTELTEVMLNNSHEFTLPPASISSCLPSSSSLLATSAHPLLTKTFQMKPTANVSERSRVGANETAQIWAPCVNAHLQNIETYYSHSFLQLRACSVCVSTSSSCVCLELGSAWGLWSHTANDNSGMINKSLMSTILRLALVCWCYIKWITLNYIILQYKIEHTLVCRGKRVKGPEQTKAEATPTPPSPHHHEWKITR